MVSFRGVVIGTGAGRASFSARGAAGVLETGMGIVLLALAMLALVLWNMDLTLSKRPVVEALASTATSSFSTTRLIVGVLAVAADRGIPLKADLETDLVKPRCDGVLGPARAREDLVGVMREAKLALGLGVPSPWPADLGRGMAVPSRDS